MIWLHPTPSLCRSIGDTEEDWERDTTWWREIGRRGWGRSQTIRRRENLVLYKSCNTLWFRPFRVNSMCAARIICCLLKLENEIWKVNYTFTVTKIAQIIYLRGKNLLRGGRILLARSTRRSSPDSQTGHDTLLNKKTVDLYHRLEGLSHELDWAFDDLNG